MCRKIDPEKITIACKVCGECFHSVEALQSHQQNFWTRLTHASLSGLSELQIHKSLYQGGRKVSCIVCEVPYGEYIPNAVQVSNTYLIEEGETHV